MSLYWRGLNGVLFDVDARVASVAFHVNCQWSAVSRLSYPPAPRRPLHGAIGMAQRTTLPHPAWRAGPDCGSSERIFDLAVERLKDEQCT